MLGYESCCFVPQELNILLVLCDGFRRTLQLEAIVSVHPSSSFRSTMER
jgi:hypothetical protein